MEKLNELETKLDNAICIINSISAIMRGAMPKTKACYNIDNLVYGVLCLSEKLEEELYKDIEDVQALQEHIDSAANALV